MLGRWKLGSECIDFRDIFVCKRDDWTYIPNFVKMLEKFLDKSFLSTGGAILSRLDQ